MTDSEPSRPGPARTKLGRRIRSTLLFTVAAIFLFAASAVSWPLGFLVLFMEVAAVSAWRRKLRFSDFFGRFPRSFAVWRYYLTVGLGAQACLTGLATLALALEVTIFPVLGAFILENDPGGMLDRPAVAIGLGVIAMPLVEEILFRGVIFRFLRHQLGLWPGLVISSLLFGCAHAEPLGNSIFGAVLAMVYVKNGGLAVPILLHALANAVALAVDQLSGASSAHATLAEFSSRPTLEAGAALFVFGLPFLIHFIRRDYGCLREAPKPTGEAPPA